MFRQRAEIFNYILRAHDVGIIVASFLLAYSLRMRISHLFPSMGPLYPINEYLWILILAIPVWLIILKYHDAYESSRKKRAIEIVWIVTRSTSISTIVLFAVLFITKSIYISRLFILLFGLTTQILLISGRAGIRIVLREMHRRGYYCRNILIIGTGKRARTYAERMSSHGEWGLRVIGYVDDRPTKSDQEILGTQIIGKLKDLPSIIEKNVIDEVVTALPRSWFSHLENIIQTCEETGTEVAIAADFFDMTTARAHFTRFYDTPLLVYSTTSSQQLQLLIKNLLDFFGSIILLIVTSPLFFIISLIIKITSSGPIFYSQIRCSLNGRRFTMYKFRTMEINADEKLEVLKKYNEVSGPVFKIKNDPRTTSIGRLLRRMSIDELPQLINVLKGEMSLVGPRPAIPEETEQYDRWQRRRLSVKPGITCLWQVSGRSNLGFHKWMELDLHYIDNWSLWLDLRVLLKTLPAVVKGDGAC